MQALGKITKDGVFIEQLETDPGKVHRTVIFANLSFTVICIAADRVSVLQLYRIYSHISYHFYCHIYYQIYDYIYYHLYDHISYGWLTAQYLPDVKEEHLAEKTEVT